MVLTYGTALMSCTSGLKSKCSWREEQCDSLDETDLALRQGSETKAGLVLSEHARFQQRIREHSGTGEWLSPGTRCSGTAQSLRPSLLSAPTSHTRRGPCAASDYWVFGGGSHLGLPWWLRW